MKKLVIKQMTFLNFKGIRNLTIDFSSEKTFISGRNGTGKTTVFDGFTWLLFGKDSYDRKNFAIKTRDKNGIAIPRIPHEVSATLDVNGENVTITRRYIEKWTKKKGSPNETFSGHEEERLWNDVPLSVKDFEAKINDICPEHVFKFLTNPSHFFNQKPSVQRDMLFKMCGEITNEQVAESNEAFVKLLKNITGKTLEEYQLEISAKKRRLKKEIDTIPSRIDERKRDTPEKEDWSSIETLLVAAEKKLIEVETAISSQEKQCEIANAGRVSQLNHLSSLSERINKKAFEIEQKAKNEMFEAEIKLKEHKRDIEKLHRTIDNLNKDKEYIAKSIEELRSKQDILRQEWHSINAEKLAFSENDFICPTCKRPLDVSDIQQKQQDMIEAHNQHKASRLKENNAKGAANAAKIAEKEKMCIDIQKEIDLAAETLSDIENKVVIGPMEYSLIELLSKDDEYNELVKQRDKLSACIAAPVTIDISELVEEKRKISYEIQECKQKLYNRDIYIKNEQRIQELESQLRTLNEELATTEGEEFLLNDFSKAKALYIENNVNKLFNVVKFKMFETQINGAEVEACIPLVDGVPYDSANKASKVHAGIDVINAICRYEKVAMPCFFDNAESVNYYPDMISQMILLSVTKEQNLTIS